MAFALALVFVFTSGKAHSTEVQADSAPPEFEGPVHAPGSSSSVSLITLPIEVLGPDGYTASVTVDVPSPGQVSKLYLRIHSPVYRDISINPGRGPKASVRLNGGPWLGISNETADVFEHEAAYGGLNGSYHTVRMTIPISALGTPQSGSNTLRFRFNGTDGHTSGFRVIELNFLRSGGAEILSSDTFVQDDPSTWTPISENPADLSAGEELWRSAQLVEYLDGPSIQATCSDCHARDGRDLWYFAYSNRSIVERSKFHGLSEEEAEKIASYIRSLQYSDASYDYTPPGRPWNPPFQPGPGLDALPAHAWAAGAGVDAVLEDDNETFDYLNLADLAIDSRLNIREIPIAIQLPDWNEWLPDQHPKDVMTYGDAFEDSDFYNAYLTARSQLTSQGVAGVGSNLHDLIDEIPRKTKRYRKDVKNSSLAPPQGSNGWVDFQRALFHWAAIKTWEVNREWDLEDEGYRTYGDYAEARSWIGGERNPFDLAPHIITTTGSFYWQEALVGKYFSTAWYQTQLTVFDGHTVQTGIIGPTDWNYHPNHIYGIHKEGGPANPYRLLVSIQKMNQLLYHYEDSGYDEDFGIRWRQAHPGRYNPGGSDTEDFFGVANDGELAQVYNAMLSAFMDRLDAAGGPNAWANKRRVDSDGDGGYCDQDEDKLKPATWDGDTGGGCDDDWVDPVSGNMRTSDVTANGRHAEMWYWMIPQFRDAGVPEYTLNRLIDWGEDMWPQANWSALIEDPNPDPPDDPEGSTLQLQSGWNTVALQVAPVDPAVAQVVSQLEALIMVKDGAGRVFFPEQGIETLSMWNTTEAYQVLVNGSVAFPVLGEPLTAAQNPINLLAGWNLLPYFIDTPKPVEQALASILEEVQYLADDEGHIFEPATGTNTIGLLEPGLGYHIYLTQAATLTYPPN